MMSEKKTGRGKSPGSTATQFKPGQSGHSEGRTRGSRNRSAVINEVFGEKVGANIRGQSKKIPVTEAALRKLVINALGGDLKAIREVMALWEETEAKLESADESAYKFDDRDREVIDALYERMKACEEDAFLA